jgi:tyrosyl-tRNA synthetase
MKIENTIDAILSRRVSEVIDEPSIKTKFASGKQLRIKYGIDPTATSFHLGHTVPLRTMQEFQQLGHIGVFIIGDFTAQIGDPVGKSDARKMLSLQETQENAKEFVEFASKFIDMNKAEVHFQSEWYSSITLEKTIRLMATVTKDQLMRHETFRKRERDRKPLGFHEMFYTLLMAYDSVMVHPDIELGGPDQKFNFLITRQVMEKFGQSPQGAVLLKFLPGTDGAEKMSKSSDNFIGMSESPSAQFEKIMKIRDEHIIDFFNLATSVTSDALNTMKIKLESRAIHPIAAKRQLAHEIVSDIHDKTNAEAADRQFFDEHKQLKNMI